MVWFDAILLVLVFNYEKHSTIILVLVIKTRHKLGKTKGLLVLVLIN